MTQPPEGSGPSGSGSWDPSGSSSDPGANPTPPSYQPPTPPSYQPPPPSNYPPPPAPGGYGAAPPPAPGYGYGQGMPGAAPPGMYVDPGSGIALPDGVELASVGRRIGAYFLTIPLAIITLIIGYIIWGLVVWGKGKSPSLGVLGCRIWRPAENRVATFGTMALRDIVYAILQAIPFVGWIIAIVSFVMFLSDDQHRALSDRIASTVVVYDPNKVLPQ